MNKLLIFLFLLSVSCVNSQEQKSETAEGIPVFAYHRFGDDRFPSTNIDLDVFRKQLNYLKENNYRVLTLSDAVKAVKNGEAVSKSVVLTVDDGYKSFYENAFPFLKEYGFEVTIFVNTAYVGGNDFMTWEELRRIDKAGMEIGNHSHDHPHFLSAEKPTDLFHNDITKAQNLFRKHLGYSPATFSYPYGEYDKDLKREVRKMGFYAAAAQRSGVLSGKELFAIPRFPMGGPFATLEGFKSKIKMLPLQINVIEPESTTSDSNSFVFTIEDEVAPGSVQCFIEGEKLSLNKDDNRYDLVIPESKHRRQLITITAQLKEAKKYGWFSFVKIHTDVKE